MAGGRGPAGGSRLIDHDAGSLACSKTTQAQARRIGRVRVVVVMERLLGYREVVKVGSQRRQGRQRSPRTHLDDHDRHQQTRDSDRQQ